MNKWLISVLVIAAVFLVFQLVVSMTTSDIETPKYKVLKKYPRFELRQYESMMLATTNLGIASYDDKASEGFRTIASYIFGKNKSNEKIAMDLFHDFMVDCKESKKRYRHDQVRGRWALAKEQRVFIATQSGGDEGLQET